jgi:hypothetical protein
MDALIRRAVALSSFMSGGGDAVSFSPLIADRRSANVIRSPFAILMFPGTQGLSLL